MDFTLGQLEGELRRLGWPAPTERSSTAFAWSSVDQDSGTRHILAAWWGVETHRVVDDVTGESSVQPTGREGIFVTGRGLAYTTLDDAVVAIIEALNQQTDAGLLAIFSLRREFGLPNHPVVPIGKTFTVNEYGDVLRQQGLW